MNEWRQLLAQTHPNFKTTAVVTEEPSVSIEIDEAIALAESIEFAENIESVIEPENSSAELEWISPTAKLQEKLENIPDKFGFKIGEAADYVGVKQYVLRYWESEFEGLKPKKSKNGQRMYTKKDIETALLIRKLLHEDRFSIEGARSALKRLKKQVREMGKVTPQEPSITGKEEVVATAKEALKAAAVGSATSPALHLESAQALLAAIRSAKLELQLA